MADTMKQTLANIVKKSATRRKGDPRKVGRNKRRAQRRAAQGKFPKIKVPRRFHYEKASAKTVKNHWRKNRKPGQSLRDFARANPSADTLRWFANKELA